MDTKPYFSFFRNWAFVIFTWIICIFVYLFSITFCLNLQSWKYILVLIIVIFLVSCFISIRFILGIYKQNLAKIKNYTKSILLVAPIFPILFAIALLFPITNFATDFIQGEKTYSGECKIQRFTSSGNKTGNLATTSDFIVFENSSLTLPLPKSYNSIKDFTSETILPDKTAQSEWKCKSKITVIYLEKSNLVLEIQ